MRLCIRACDLKADLAATSECSQRRAALVILGLYLVCAGADSPRPALSLGGPC